MAIKEKTNLVSAALTGVHLQDFGQTDQLGFFFWLLCQVFAKFQVMVSHNCPFTLCFVLKISYWVFHRRHCQSLDLLVVYE